jgi:acetyl esterase/lipase
MRLWLAMAAVMAMIGCAAPAGAQGDRGVAYGPNPRQKLDVYRPAGGEGHPVIVFFYGGGFSSGDRGPYADLAEPFVKKGFVVVIPDYRLYPQVTYPEFVRDGAAAVRWTRDHVKDRGGDPARIAVIGHSAGAYIASMVALDPRWLAEAGAPGAVKAFAGFSGPYAMGPERRGFRDIFQGHADADPKLHVTAASPPSFLAAGDADTLVQPAQSLALAKALHDKGAVAEAHVYPGLDHFETMYAVMDGDGGQVLADVTAFLAAHDK